MVDVSRQILRDFVGNGQSLEISDPLRRVRSAGKVYIYPKVDGWEVSGQYRRKDQNSWNKYLMKLDSNVKLVSLVVADDSPSVQDRAKLDSRLILLD